MVLKINMMHKVVKISFAILLLSIFSTISIAQNKDFVQLENQLQTVVRKVHPTSVFIWDYDPKTKTKLGGNFSGVAIDADGRILTAAHACKPKQNYLIMFPNGQEHEATCLGTVPRLDLAVMKINEKGNWPYAEMGWSSSLQVGEPVLSIAYPASYNERREVIRFGYVSVLNSQRGRRFTSTCLMEPGDSGGPVYDRFGRVVGIHSSIDRSLAGNYEVPIDLFRKYWTALQDPQAYTELPAEDAIAADPLLERSRETFVTVQTSLASFPELEAKFDPLSIQISSAIGDTITNIVGTLLSVNGKSYVLSKSSMVGQNPTVGIDKGRPGVARVISRDLAADLVLLAIDKKNKAGIKLTDISTDTLVFNDLSKFLISPNPDNPGQLSVLGTTTFSVRAIANAGYLGAGVEIKDNKLFFSSVNAKSPASEGKLSVGLQLVSINGKAITDIPSYINTVQMNAPGDELIFITKNEEKVDTLSIKLGKRPMAATNHVAELFTDGKSVRRDGFPEAFAHDAKLKPNECGGPVFDRNGKFMGINIARLSRTSSIAIPANVVAAFVKESLKINKTNNKINR
jgi:serine protease Do